MRPKFLLLLAAPFVLLSCMKDTVTETYSYYEPVYQTKTAVKAGIRNAPAEEIAVPGKIVLMGNYLYLNDVDKGIHVIDITDPSNPIKRYFIHIPGCVDIAINGNYLYADCYTDLVTLDISDPSNISVKQFINGVFPNRYYGLFTADTSKVIMKWVKKESVVTKQYAGTMREKVAFVAGGMLWSSFSGASFAGSAATGIAGSMARFGLQQNRLYTVGHSDLSVFNVTKPDAPSFVTKTNLSMGNIETIFPYKNNLFLGGQSGMLIYSTANPDQPARLGAFSHARACDPVVADDDYAYVTLRGGTFCGGFTNQLDVVNVKNLVNPFLVKTYPLKAPKGLSKDGNLLFICDGTDGLKLFDASDVNNITLLTTIAGFDPDDVIAYHGIAFTVAKDGIYLVDYRNVTQVAVVGKIQITR